jgi:hypothetical protein
MNAAVPLALAAGLMGSIVGVAGAAETAPTAPSFLNVIEPLLTRLGCNQGACHGKGAGQNGFRLSLRGYAPEYDHPWITREYLGRRISRSAPEQSLLITKPAGVVPHAGGVLFAPESREYQTLLAWLSAGAPGPDKNDPHIVRLEVTPGIVAGKLGQSRQLTAKAEFSDGKVHDVTWLAKFESNDAGMVEVDWTGRAKFLRHGETAIRVSFLGLVTTATFTSAYEQTVNPAGFPKANNFIDTHVFAKLAALKIEPAETCDDAEFCRRAFLDAIGLLPTPAEVRAFLDDRSADKRSKLIDALLARPEFVDYWALQFGDLFQNRRERDHDVRGSKGVRQFHDWLRRQVAVNRPWDELARDVLLAAGGTDESPQIGYFVVTVGEKRRAADSEVVASVAQSFLGTRIGCAQCHNHPLEKYTQDDYYHFAGFFSRLKLERKDPRVAPTRLVAADPDARPGKSGKVENGKAGVVQPRTGKFLTPRPLDRAETTIDAAEDPRVKLAAWMTDPKNEFFSGNLVNRLWKHFFSVGLVEPIDDLRATNPPSNPELWAALNREFVGQKFDVKHLMRVILNSRTYQLASSTKPANESDAKYYSHYYIRRLPAEVLSDALSAATGVPDVFPGYPVGLRAVQLPDPKVKSYFLSLFGRSERVTACACERSGDVTMAQLLHMQNGESVVMKIRAADGRLSALLKNGNDDAVTEELFLATLSRRPTAPEMAAVKKELSAAGAAGRDEFFRDLFWALLNSKEFAFNH